MTLRDFNTLSKMNFKAHVFGEHIDLSLFFLDILLTFNLQWWSFQHKEHGVYSSSKIMVSAFNKRDVYKEMTFSYSKLWAVHFGMWISIVILITCASSKHTSAICFLTWRKECCHVSPAVASGVAIMQQTILPYNMEGFCSIQKGSNGICYRSLFSEKAGCQNSLPRCKSKLQFDWCPLK